MNFLSTLDMKTILAGGAVIFGALILFKGMGTKAGGTGGSSGSNKSSSSNNSAPSNDSNNQQ